MNNKLVVYWKTCDSEKLAFYNDTRIIQALGGKVDTCIPLCEFEKEEDSDELETFQSACSFLDEATRVMEGDYFSLRDNTKADNQLEYTYVVTDEDMKEAITNGNSNIHSFKLPYCNMWCVKCTMEPELEIYDDDDDDDEYEDNWL